MVIYLVEDDDNIRKLVCYALEREGYEVKGFSLPSEFWEGIQQEIPKLIILDIMLPQEDGLSILSRLRSADKTKNVPVIMLTAKDSEYDRVTGLDMGADDYISKPFGMTELTARVRALLRRSYREEQSEGIYRIGDLYVNSEKNLVKYKNEEIMLSYKEYSLLNVLLKANGKTVKRETLLARVWGEYYDESRTLDVHIRKLRVKLKEAGELIKTVKNVGYRIEVDELDK